jgi:hypothetical protein
VSRLQIVAWHRLGSREDDSNKLSHPLTLRTRLAGPASHVPVAKSSILCSAWLFSPLRPSASSAFLKAHFPACAHGTRIFVAAFFRRLTARLGETRLRSVPADRPRHGKLPGR